MGACAVILLFALLLWRGITLAAHAPDRFGALLVVGFVVDVYKRQRYIGENHFKDIVMPDSIPAIVDKDLFEEVQLKIKKNSRAPARHKAEDDYLLTTKLFCGMCGAMMFGECGTGRNKVVHHYYCLLYTSHE